MSVDHVEAGKAVLSLPYNQSLVGDPDSGVIHGGPVSTLLDSTLGLAVMAHPDGDGMTATIDLRIDYMRPAKPEHKITASGEVYHVTRTVAFVRGTAWADDREKPVAMATGAFVFKRKDAKL